MAIFEMYAIQLILEKSEWNKRHLIEKVGKFFRIQVKAVVHKSAPNLVWEILC